MKVTRKQDLLAVVIIGALATAGFGLALPAAAANLDGQVLGGGAPIANASVTLWQAGSGTPRQLAQARSGADGRFAVAAPGAPLAEGSLYLVARGGTPAAGKGGGAQATLHGSLPGERSVGCARRATGSPLTAGGRPIGRSTEWQVRGASRAPALPAFARFGCPPRGTVARPTAPWSGSGPVKSGTAS